MSLLLKESSAKKLVSGRPNCSTVHLDKSVFVGYCCAHRTTVAACCGFSTGPARN